MNMHIHTCTYSIHVHTVTAYLGGCLTRLTKPLSTREDIELQVV